ncbi:MAG: thiolase family protein [Candidatus Omnitrophica bacterium]|nr:thiolase family protein [Candidatus Omnitrophota bacterium]
MKKVAVIDGIRTPFVKSWTLFDRLSAHQLGALCVNELLQRTDLDAATVDEVIFGCVGEPVDAANVARVISIYGGIPKDKPAYTVNRNCASSFESVTSAVEKIRLGLDQIVIAGGTESMSNAPFLFGKDMAVLLMKLAKAKTFFEKLSILFQIRFQHLKPISALQLALTDPTCGLNMGQTAEVLAKEFGISRMDQDAFALRSHQRAIAAREKLREEIVPVRIPPDYEIVVQDDNGPRENQSMETLAKLRPVFDRYTGTVTAGNSSQITDGACVLLLMDAEKAKSLGYKILGSIEHYAYVGLDPSRMGLGPVFAIEKVLRQSSLALKDMELVEINEAFAVQVLACLEALGSQEFAKRYFSSASNLGLINLDILNVNGGAIAIGHPVGTSGARLILTCLNEMKRRSLKRGLVSLCVGGGQGGAIILERE